MRGNSDDALSAESKPQIDDVNALGHLVITMAAVAFVRHHHCHGKTL